jgi:hypothetical protein
MNYQIVVNHRVNHLKIIAKLQVKKMDLYIFVVGLQGNSKTNIPI